MVDTVSNSFGVAGRYAIALFGLAQESSQVEAVEADLKALGAAFDESADLRKLISSPLISRADQARALDAVLTAMRVSELTRRFVGVVAENRRLFALPKIIEAFEAILADWRGEMTAEITSYRDLKPNEVSGLEGALKGALGRTVSIKQKVDAGVLGGLIVKVGSVMVDSSLRTRLNRLEIAMREVS